MISASSGLVMAQGSPAVIAMATNVALSALRLGRPKEMLLAPHTVLAQLLAHHAHNLKQVIACPVYCAHRHSQRINQNIWQMLVERSARSTIFFATNKRSQQVMAEMPVSSLLMAITAAWR